MNRRTVGTGAALLALTAALAGCSSSGHKAASTTTAERASTTSADATSTTSTTAIATTTVVPSTRPPTTAPGSGPTTPPPPDAETADKQFFAAWLANDLDGMLASGTGSALHEATLLDAHASGATWELSNCQGAAGSQYCTWVRAAEDVVVRASDVSPVNRVVEFQWNALQAPDIAQQFLTAWEFGSTNAVQALATSGAASQTQALSAHRTDGWQAPSSCDGTAGSFYCTYTAGSHTLQLQVGDVSVPHQVIGVTYH